jgi:hypothetical protein
MEKYFSFSKNAWVNIPEADNFLTTLLNLRLQKIDEADRKKIGNSRSALWQPRMVVNGQIIPGVIFDAWRTQWPNDGSDLAGKAIEVYTPQENEIYPSYFPYWLQISGNIAKAKIRIIDSGSEMHSPKPKW